MEVKLTDYDKAYLPAMIALFTETVRQVNRADYTEEECNAWAPVHQDGDKWHARFSADYTRLAFLEGQLAGFGNITDEGYFDMLYVHKDLQKRGVASKIAAELEKRALTLGVSFIEVHASITAKPFFLRRGYEVQKEQQVERFGVFLTNYVMKKRIG